MTHRIYISVQWLVVGADIRLRVSITKRYFQSPHLIKDVFFGSTYHDVTDALPVFLIRGARRGPKGPEGSRRCTTWSWAKLTSAQNQFNSLTKMRAGWQISLAALLMSRVRGWIWFDWKITSGWRRYHPLTCNIWPTWLSFDGASSYRGQEYSFPSP